jgi:sulfatase maturation enzyme AslB (radical SAM superfamily)
MIETLSSRTVCRAVGGAMDFTLRRFPRVVRIETTNACNARCTICPHRTLRRKIERMDDGLFTRIIDECAGAGCAEVHLHNFGEPLLDSRLADRIRYAKQQGLPKVKIFSNGSLLDERRARELIDAGLDEIKISFDGATREEFERVRFPLQFDQVVENICRLVVLRNEVQSSLRIEVACCSTSDQQATMSMLQQVVDGFSFGKIHNWAGQISTSARRRVRKPCSRLWNTFTVLASGDVALCCLDYDGQHLLGRLEAGTSIRDIWPSSAYRMVRQCHKQARQERIELCRDCSKSFLYSYRNASIGSRRDAFQAG